MLSQGMGRQTYRKNRNIILASASKRRKKILKQAGIKFKAIKSNLNEDLLIKKIKKSSPNKLVKILSLAKAISVLRRDKIIAAFDTVIICKNKIIGKPKNKKDALKILLFLSNKEHKVYTGMAIINIRRGMPQHASTPIITTDCEITKVKMKKISRQEAIDYIKTGEPMDKAGAYAIQGKGRKFIKSICGDYLNVVGLPLKRFLLRLSK